MLGTLKRAWRLDSRGPHEYHSPRVDHEQAHHGPEAVGVPAEPHNSTFREPTQTARRRDPEARHLGVGPPQPRATAGRCRGPHDLEPRGRLEDFEPVSQLVTSSPRRI